MTVAEKATHTPGPWRVGPYYRHEVVSDSGVICYARIETERTRADARLIAAAPEMLEALEELMLILKDTVLPTAVEGYVRAAIRKARGEV